MGCSFSRIARRDADSNPHVFKVFNVDDQGQELSAGKIEITDTDLILHQKSKDSIRWPLRSLRRYGFDAELFSFESGRRCPTGPGIYAFKCRRAEALFNLLQECIQRAGQEEQQQRHAGADGGGGGGGGGSSRPSSLVEIQSPNGSVQVLHNSGVQVSSNPSPHHYINGYVAAAAAASATTTTTATENCVSPSHTGAPVTSPSSGTVASLAGRTHEYVNTEIAVGAVGPPSSSACGSRQSLDMSAIQVRMPRVSPGVDAHVINYIELDLPKSAEEVSASGAVGATTDVEGESGSSQATYINVPASGHGERDGAHFKPPSLSAGVASSAAGGTGDGAAARKLCPPLKEDPHNYANLDLLNTRHGEGRPMASMAPSSTVGSPSSSSSASAAAAGGGEGRAGGRKVTYIQVDVHNSRENLYNGPNPPASPISLTPSIPESPRRTESYAQIDFYKTAALSKGSNEDEGSRKTRHNSNIEELN